MTVALAGPRRILHRATDRRRETRSPAGRPAAVSGSPGVYLLSATGPVEPRRCPSTSGTSASRSTTRRRRIAAPPIIALARDRPTSTGRPPRCGPGRGFHAAGFRRPLSCGRPERLLSGLAQCAPAGGYQYAATVPKEALPEGRHEFAITAFRGRSAVTFPGGAAAGPPTGTTSSGAWSLDVVRSATSLVLFDPDHRHPSAHVHPHRRCGTPRALQRGNRRGDRAPDLPSVAAGGFDRLESGRLRRLPTVVDRVRAQGGDDRRRHGRPPAGARPGPSQVLHVTLMEDDGTSWSSALAVDTAWSERRCRSTDSRSHAG